MGNGSEVIITNSEDETEAIGERLATEELESGSCLALSGELGGGKTCIVRGIARGLGVSSQVKSPSFTILHVYEGGRLPLYHIDLYRLEGAYDTEELGLEEYVYGRGITVIEWAEKAGELIPDEAIRIEFEYVDEDKRRIVIKRPGE